MSLQHDTDREQYDVSLHLLDRQIVGADERLVAKVDDVELTRRPDGSLVPTALLVGLPVLLPRLGDRLGRGLADIHRLSHDAAADRDLPLLIDLDLVDRMGSDVRLTEAAHGLLERMDRSRADDPDRLRVGEVLGLPVRAEGLPRPSKVLDLSIVGSPARPGRHEVVSLLVGPGRPGALLGYDRRSEPGPALVAGIVRWLHRHARVVAMGRGVTIDLGGGDRPGEVRIAPGTSLRRLRG